MADTMTNTESELITSAPLQETTEKTDASSYDILSHYAYDGVKKIWGYGCGISMAKPILKKTEEVADKVLNYATGYNLEQSDDELKPKLAELDAKFVNPAIAKLFTVLTPYYAKADDQLRPVVSLLIRKLYFLPPFANKAVEEKSI